ncbi:MAG: oligosaccharide flippase family protein [Phycisphaerae bacterium]|nr:oligosaccharide flippase family protein [Phycisphaerae bacterium]
MSLRGRVLKGAASLAAGQAVGQGLSFVRNIIVARLIKPEDFGIAATFAITLSLLQLISDLSADKLIIQAKDGDDPELDGTAQLWLFVRGLFTAGFVLLLAWPASTLFKVPQARSAFCWLALVPLLRGLVHLDLKRLQRTMRFGPQIRSEIGAQAVATTAAWPFARFFGDYSAVLWLVILQSATMAILSNVFAERRYRWVCNHAHMVRLLSFGWPLLVNGLLMFSIFQGDRLIIGTAYSMYELGIYSVAVVFAQSISRFLGSVIASLLLPAFSEVQEDRTLLENRYTVSVQFIALIAGLAGACLIVFAERLLAFLYGPRYLAAAGALCWLVAAESLRLIRIAPNAAALARLDSQNSMYANVWRTAGIPLAVVVGVLRWDTSLIAACALVAELLAIAACAISLRLRHGLGLRPLLQAIVMPGAAILVAGVTRATCYSDRLWFCMAVSGGICVILLLCMVAYLAPLRTELTHALVLIWQRVRATRPLLERRFGW